MTRKTLPLLIVVAIAWAGLQPPPARAVDPVTLFVAEFVLAKILDVVFDATTGKPDVNLLKQRLDELEKNTALRSEMREQIRQLRERIDESVTRDEFRKWTDELVGEIGTIKKRLDAVEYRVELLEVKVEDKDNNTRYATDPDFFLARSKKFLADKELFRALANAGLAIELRLDHSAGYVQRGQVYAALGSLDVAIIDFQQALKVNPHDAEAYRRRGDAYLAKLNYAAAEKDFTAALDAGAKEPGIRLNRGWANLKLNRPAAARDDFSTVLTGDAGTVEARVGLGAAAIDEKDFDRAESALNAALEREPRHALAHAYLARLLERKKLTDLARSEAERAVELAPGNLQVCLVCGDVSFGLKDYDLAARRFSQALKTSPKNAEALKGRGLAYLESEKTTDDAIRDFEEVLRQFPQDASCWTLAAKGYFQKKDYQATKLYATKAIQLDNGQDLAYYLRGRAGDTYQQAVDDFYRAVQANPKAYWAWNERGWTYYMMGQKGYAIDQYNESLKVNQDDNAEAYYFRGFMHKKSGSPTEAQADLEKALNSKDARFQEMAFEQLLAINPENAEMMKAFPKYVPTSATAGGTYKRLLRRIRVEGDKDIYGEFKNYGESSTTSYNYHEDLPKGHWVYVYPHWYIWGEKNP